MFKWRKTVDIFRKLREREIKVGMVREKSCVYLKDIRVSRDKCVVHWLLQSTSAPSMSIVRIKFYDTSLVQVTN